MFFTSVLHEVFVLYPEIVYNKNIVRTWIRTHIAREDVKIVIEASL
jgi:hypothetical protein